MSTKRTWPGGGAAEVMIGSVGDNEGGKEVAGFASTVMLLPSLHSVCVRLCRQLHLNVHSWRERERRRGDATSS